MQDRSNAKLLEEQHQIHQRQGLPRPDCPLCWRTYHRHLLSIPRRPVVPYDYQPAYRLAPGKVVVDAQWHPHIVAKVQRESGGDNDVQFAVVFEDGEQCVYQLKDLINFLDVDPRQIMALYESQGKLDAASDAALLERSYEEADVSREASAHLDRYQQRLKQSEVESDRVYYQAYLETWTSLFSEGQGATNG